MRAVAAAAVLALALPAAAEPIELRVSAAPDGCPSPALLVKALAQAVPGARVTLDPAGNVELIDLGPAYRVTVNGVAREFADSRQRCRERARSAATYVALMLEQSPPTPAPVPAPVPVPVPVPAPVPAPVRASFASEVHIDAELSGGPLFAAGGNPIDGGVSGAAALRFAASWRFIGVFFGVGYAPATLRLGTASAELQRVPVDLGVRGQLRWRRLEGVADAGLALVVDQIGGRGFAENLGETVADVGGRLAVALRVWLVGRVALFAGVEAVLVGGRSLATRSATVGETPTAWLAVQLGLSLRIR